MIKMGDKMIYQNLVLTAIALLLLALFIVIIIEIRLNDKNRITREPCSCEDCETEKEILKERLDSKKFRMKYSTDKKLAELERKNNDTRTHD